MNDQVVVAVKIHVKVVLIVEKGKINSNLINSSTFNKFGFGIPTLFDVSHLTNKVMNF